MIWSYDVSTDRGKVRLLATDTDTSNQIFSDAEVDAFLNLHGADVLYAAAEALDTIATNEALVLKVLSVMDVSTSGDRLAAALMARADKLRKQSDEHPATVIDYAEVISTPSQYRERLLNQVLRTGA